MDKPVPDTPGASDPGNGRRLGIDVGTVRVGVSYSDRDAKLAMPLETITRVSRNDEPNGSDIDRLSELIRQYQIVEVVVGLPRDLKGHGSASVVDAQDFAERLRGRLHNDDSPAVIRFGDERLTTVAATTALRASGVSAKAGRKIIDQAAAVEILQTWLDGRRNFLARAERSTSDHFDSEVE